MGCFVNKWMHVNAVQRNGIQTEYRTPASAIFDRYKIVGVTSWMFSTRIQTLTNDSIGEGWRRETFVTTRLGTGHAYQTLTKKISRGLHDIPTQLQNLPVQWQGKDLGQSRSSQVQSGLTSANSQLVIKTNKNKDLSIICRDYKCWVWQTSSDTEGQTGWTGWKVWYLGT